MKQLVLLSIVMFFFVANTVLAGEEASKLTPTLSNVYNKARNDYKNNNYSIALVGFNQVLAEVPNHTGSNFLKGFILYKQKDYKNAIPCLAKAHKNESANFDIVFYLGMSYYKSNDFNSAIDYLTKAEKLKTDDAMLYYTLGSIYYSHKQTEKAIEYLKKSESLGVKDDVASVNLGSIYLEKQDFKNALAQYILLIAKYPNTFDYQYNAGVASEKLNQREAAMAYYEAANTIDPSNAQLQNKLGNLAQMKGDKDQASKYYKQANNNGLQDTDVNALYDLGCLYQQEKKYSDAIETFQQSIDKNQNVAKSYFKIALINGGLNNNREAISNYIKATESDPNMIVAYYNMGLIYKQMGNFKETVKIGDELSKKAPNDARGFGLMAIGYSYLGDNENAEKYRAKATEVDRSYTFITKTDRK